MRILQILEALLFLAGLSNKISSVSALATHYSISPWVKDIQIGYRRRVAADPNFPVKSGIEVFLALSTQFAAEWETRGRHQLIPQIDFVVPALLTAVTGKYMSMWMTAPTRIDTIISGAVVAQKDPKLESIAVPTNAFQKYMLDGITPPTLSQRLGSFIVPMWPLFRLGCISSFLAYGFTSILIELRKVVLPNYIPITQNINVVHATLFTGCFMAVVSNIRYQILQGIIEPMIDRALKSLPILRTMIISVVRILNGLLGSILSVSGMQLLGLQRLKT
jgi:hypothetical protein